MASVLFLTATDKERLKIKPLLARHSILEELAVSWRIESVAALSFMDLHFRVLLRRLWLARSFMLRQQQVTA